MIISTGMRTDIPAFYGKWLINRLNAGFVCVASGDSVRTHFCAEKAAFQP